MDKKKIAYMVRDGDVLGVYLAIHAKSDILYKHIDYLLRVAVSFGHIDIATLLIEQGADINNQDKDGNTVLHTFLLVYSSSLQKQDIEMLLGLGAHLNTRNNKGQLARDMAIEKKVPSHILSLLT